MLRNHVQIIGRVGNDLQLAKTQSGMSYVQLSVAVSRRKKQGEDVPKTDWFKVTTWGHTAEYAAKYIHKGDLIGVEGRLQTDSYERNGNRITVTSVIGDELQILRQPQTPQSNTTQAQQTPQSNPVQEQNTYDAQEGFEIDPNDLPF